MLRLLPPEEYGRLAIFLSIQFFSVPMITFGAESLIAVKRAKLGSACYEQFRCTYVTFAGLMFVFWQFVFVVVFALELFHDALLLLVPVYGLVRFLINTASTEYVMEQKATHFGVVGFSTSLSALFLTILLLSQIAGVADWRVAALLISDAVFLLVRYRGRLRLLWTFIINLNEFKNIARFGFPLLVSVGPAWALLESDKIIVSRLADMASVGFYAAACSIGGIMTTFNAAMVNAALPSLYKALEDSAGDIRTVSKRYIIKFLVATVVFGCSFALVYGLTASWILPDKYSAARPIVYVIIICSLGRSVYGVLGLVGNYYEMTVVRLIGFLCGGATSVVVSILFVSQYGVIGAALGVGAGYLSLSAVLWFAVGKKSDQLMIESRK